MGLVTVALVLFISMSLNFGSCEGYRILAVFPLSRRSHFIMFEALIKGLARKGHQVDVVSAFPQKQPYANYTDIVNLQWRKVVNNLTYNEVISKYNCWQCLMHAIINEHGNGICTGLQNPKMLKLIRNPPSDPPYDLVITEFLSAHCYMALGYHLKVATIAISSLASLPWINTVIANPTNLAFVPNSLIGYAEPITLWERVFNTLFTAYNVWYIQYHTHAQDDVIKKYFGDDAPSVRKLERNLALIMTNSHPSLNAVKPVTPALIEVGGLHIQDNGEQVDEDLQNWMNDCTHGFVYLTFGSMIKIETFPEESIRALFKSLQKITPIRILMKIPEPERLPVDVPKNCRTFKWISQYQVLKHKNVKAFITHGGLMGTQEAIHFAVPMIGIPLFGDQFYNVNLYVKKKIAVKVNFDDITEESMDKALNAILYNSMYKNMILDVSKKFTDRPMSPLDTAIWWVEYVIRHGGEGLRSPAMNLTWWQVELLDVYAFLLIITSCLVFATFVLARYLFKIRGAMV